MLLLPQSPSFIFVLEHVHEIIPRGGDDANSDDDDEDGYDDDDVEEEYDNNDDDKEDPPSSRRQDPRQQSRRPDPYDHRMARPPAPRRRSKQQQHWTQRLASQSLQMGGQLAWNAVKQPGKVAYHLIRPKHVEECEIGGLWRLDQQITSPEFLASVATVELDVRRKRVILNNGKEIVPYTFTKSKYQLGSSFQTEFIARAFLMGDTPRLYGYRGTWQRKLADTNVIKLVGNIYKVRKPRFGNGPCSFVGAPIGTFVARRRVQLLDDDDEEEEDEYDDDEYDNDEEERHFEEDEENDGEEDYDDEDDTEEEER